MSPKHVRKSHLVRSSGNDDPIFCETTFDKYYSMSPSSMNSFRDDTRGKLDHLDAEAAAAETNAKRRLFLPAARLAPLSTRLQLARRIWLLGQRRPRRDLMRS